MTDEKVRARAQHFRHLKREQLYPAFTGWVQGALLDREMSDAERLADIQLSLAALDMVLAETSAHAGIAAASEVLHYLEPGAGDGDLTDILSCGLTVATSGSGYVTDPDRVTCGGCRMSALLDGAPR